MKKLWVIASLILILFTNRSFSQSETITSKPFRLTYSTSILGNAGSDTSAGNTAVKYNYSTIDKITTITLTQKGVLIGDNGNEIDYSDLVSVSTERRVSPVPGIVGGALVGMLSGFVAGSATNWPFGNNSTPETYYMGIGSVIGGVVGYFFFSKPKAFKEYKLQGINNYQIKMKIRRALDENFYGR